MAMKSLLWKGGLGQLRSSGEGTLSRKKGEVQLLEGGTGEGIKAGESSVQEEWEPGGDRRIRRKGNQEGIGGMEARRGQEERKPEGDRRNRRIRKKGNQEERQV